MSEAASSSVPVYGRPDDLVQVTPDVLRAFYNGGLSVMRRSGEELVPYYTRAEIEKGALGGRGLELLYLDDPVELFFLQIQGSGRVRLTDGSWVRIGYAAKNGHSYTSIGKAARRNAARKPPGGLTMEGLKGWLRADPARGRALMHENKSYIFFRELPEAEAGRGSGRRSRRAADARAQPRRRCLLSCPWNAGFRRGAGPCASRGRPFAG